MDESFEIPVNYNGGERNFKARLLLYGYSHKIEVEVEGSNVFFEPDEERNYRAVVNPDSRAGTDPDVQLLKSIAGSLESILK